MAYTRTLKNPLARYGRGAASAMSGYPGRVSSALKRYGRSRNPGVMSGCGGLGDCGADQVLDPSVVVGGYAQCVPVATYQANHPSGVAPTQSTSPATGGSWFDSLMKGFANVTTPQQPQPVMMPPSSGISTTTVVVIGAALVGVALLMKKRD